RTLAGSIHFSDHPYRSAAGSRSDAFGGRRLPPQACRRRGADPRDPGGHERTHVSDSTHLASRTMRLLVGATCAVREDANTYAESNRRAPRHTKNAMNGSPDR